MSHRGCPLRVSPNVWEMDASVRWKGGYMITVNRMKGFSARDELSSVGTGPEARSRNAVVLAGGDGRRLEPFVRRLRGDALPKQYVSLYGTHSLLDRTFERVERLIPPDRIMTVVTRDHFRYDEACRQLARRPKGTVIVQPQNKDTAPGLLLPLTYLRRRSDDELVAVFPSDHNVANDWALMDHVETAFLTLERRPDLIILLGVKPDRPESDYGYVLPGAPMTGVGRSDVRGVSAFFEKPPLRRAEALIQQGAYWNTSILVFRLRTLLDLMWRITPFLPLGFSDIAEAIDTTREYEVIDAVYRSLPPVNLSRGVLELASEMSPSPLAVLRVNDASWSDWGAEHRILRDLHAMDAHGSRAAQGPLQ